MKEILKDAINVGDADYMDIRHEHTKAMTISCFGRDIDSVNTSLLSGGHVRALKGGGIAFQSFTSLDQIKDSVTKVCRAAEAVGRVSGIKDGLAKTPVIKDDVKPTPEIDPRNVSFEDKIALLSHYAELILSQKGIHTANLTYEERLTTSNFVNSDGCEITQDILFCRLGGRIYAKDGKRIESTSFSIGYDSDYKKLLNRESEAESKVKTVLNLLKAEKIPGGVYTVVCDQDLGGIFVHEGFGHLAESDALIPNRSLRELMQIGKQVGSPILNIIDQGNIPGAPGSYPYDHEGVPSQKTYIVKNGVLIAYLHSKNSAYRLGGKPTGNCRSSDYRVNPIVRMSNICIDKGESKVEEMIGSLGSGYYLCGARGGQTMGDAFTFGAQYGYEIKDGKIGKMVSDINISGNVFSTLSNMMAVGDDFRISEWGGCGKCRLAFYHMQMLSKSGVGSPHIKIKDVVIGGR